MTITRHTMSAVLQVAPYWATVGTGPVWADDWQTTPLAWTSSALTVTKARPAPFTRDLMALSYATTGLGRNATRTVPTTPGKSYRMVATVWTNLPDMHVGVTRTVLGVRDTALPVETATLRWGIFTATSATSVLTIEFPTVGVSAPSSGTVYVIDVALWEVEYTTYLDPHPVRAAVTLDSEWSPYVQADLVCPLPDPDALALIDPRSADEAGNVLPQLRATITLASDSGESDPASSMTAFVIQQNLTTAAQLTAFVKYYGLTTAAMLTELWSDQLNTTVDPALVTQRTFDVHLRTRTVDFIAGTMTLTLTSDELYLQDFKRYDTTSSTWTPPAATSLRALVNWALGKLGWSLQGAGTDVAIDSTAVVWNLGESMWSFLDAFVRGSGKRLWCDEARRWWLTDALPEVAGAATITALTSCTDTLSRDDEAYGDAAVMLYEWTDAAGAQQRRSAASTTPEVLIPKVVVQSFAEQRSPGTAALTSGAARMRARVLSRGRRVSARAVSSYTVTPGQQALITTPAAEVTTSLVSAVTWTLPDDEMDVVTRDLTTAP